MANTGLKGVDVRQTGNQLVFRVFQTTSGAVLTTGTTTLEIYELQSDGTLSSYDFNSNTFKTTALTTATVNMTHRTGNNSTTNTGLWTYALSTLTGFTIGGMYLVLVRNSSADVIVQAREFQYGSAEGDVVAIATGTGTAKLDSITSIRSGTAQAGGSSTITLDSGAPSTTDIYKAQFVLIISGTGAGQVRCLTAYNGSTKVATASTAWATQPDSTSVFVMIPAHYVGVAWNMIINPTTTNALSNTTIANTQQVDLKSILTTVLTETTLGNITAAVKKFFDVATPVHTTASVDQTGDTYGRVGSAGAGLTAIGDTRIANLDAAVSTRSTYAGGDTTGTTTLLGRLTSTRAGLLDNLSNVDVTVSSRLATSGYTTPPTSAAIVTALWTDLLSSTDFSTAASIGKLLKDNIDAAISSRSSGSDTPGTTTLLGRLTSTRSGLLDNLSNVDVTVSSRLATSGYTTPPTVAAIGNALLVDGTTNKIKVNSDNSVNAGSTGTSVQVGSFSSGALTQLSGMSIVVQSPSQVDVDHGILEIVAGDDYLNSFGRAFQLTFTGVLPDMTGGQANLALVSASRIVRIFTATILSSSNSTLVIRLELTATNTATLEPGDGTWQPQFTTAAGKAWTVPGPTTDAEITDWILRVIPRRS